jgi:hypothetical protein
MRRVFVLISLLLGSAERAAETGTAEVQAG